MKEKNKNRPEVTEDTLIDISSGWGLIYMLVVLYSVILVVVLHFLTIVLDFSST